MAFARRGAPSHGRRSAATITKKDMPFRATADRRSSVAKPLQSVGHNRANAGARRRAVKRVTRLPEELIGVVFSKLNEPFQLAIAEASCRWFTPIIRDEISN